MAQDDGMPYLKRSSSSPEGEGERSLKRQKRHYHHNHKLHQPIQAQQHQEPTLLDDGTVTHLLERSIGQILTSTGYDIAEPTALDAFRQAAEEYILHLASFARQAMTASRRVQPIPQDFEFALGRAFIRTDELLPHIKPLAAPEKNVPTLLPSPPPEEQLFNAFDGMPVLSKDLSGDDERQRFNYIPSHFPHFPSKHTYRFTPVYTERETDPRRIRELGMEDSRFGEEALRKLARAAFKDTRAAGFGKGESRLWGRKHESAESMFEKTMRGLTKRKQKTAAGDGQAADAQGVTQKEKENGKSSLANLDLAPIVNCERDLWRKSTTGQQKAEKVPENTKDSAVAKVERWVST